MEEIGEYVYCLKCGKRKAPVGRSVPLEMGSSLCNHQCEGYYEEPKPGQLWPGETRSEFGF